MWRDISSTLLHHTSSPLSNTHTPPPPSNKPFQSYIHVIKSFYIPNTYNLSTPHTPLPTPKLATLQHTCTCTYKHSHAHTNIHTHMQYKNNTHVYTHKTHMHTHIIHMHTLTSTDTHTCIHTHMHTHIHTLMHRYNTRTHMHRHAHTCYR